MPTITAKFPTRCFCGASVSKGDRINWIKGSGVQVCTACAPKVLAKDSVAINGVTYSVVIKGREGRVTRASVGVCLMEYVGNGAIHFAANGELIGIGAHSPMVRADLCDYIDGAKKAARAIAIKHNLKK